ncbi:MAG: superoxide dismutase family protein [Candidatus Omnitrophica bacterium]|nr:superoxide dismutase family protein [Candidatus Omnitrophota bacterium]
MIKIKQAGLCAGILFMAISTATVWAQTGSATLTATTEGSDFQGSGNFSDTPKGLRVEIQVSGASPGPHGVHVHQFGLCGDKGQAAGGHFNPAHSAHGLMPRDGLLGAHPGDLGNIEIGPDGNGLLAALLPGVSLSDDVYGVAGRALIVHERADDFSQPVGNAGGRIGCGAILIGGP